MNQVVVDMNQEREVSDTIKRELKESNLVSRLKQALGESRALDATLHMFAARERARADVTIGSLAQRMKREGFNFNTNEYDQVLRFLAELGFGTLEYDKRGKVKALREISVSLQSIGRVALGQDKKLLKFNPRNKFEHLDGGSVPNPIKDSDLDKVWNTAPVIGTKFTLSFHINDKVINLDIPDTLTSTELSALVSKLSST